MYFHTQPAKHQAVEQLRRKTEQVAVKTWTFTLTANARYENCSTDMQIAGGSLKRSLHDFAWVRAALVQEWPGVMVPAITAEATQGDSSVLERFIAKCASHPDLQTSALFKCFVLSPPSEFYAAQRDFIADGAPPPLAVQVNALFLKAKAKWTPDKEPDDGKSSETVDDARRWLAIQTPMMDKALLACLTATQADAKAAATNAGARESVSSLVAVEPPAVEDATFGPANALPLLRDMVGSLNACTEAMNGRESVRRELAAAVDNLEKHTHSSKTRQARLESAERNAELSKEAETSAKAEDSSTKKAKGIMSALKFKAAATAAKAGAAISSKEVDVEKATKVLERLKDKFEKTDERFARDYQVLKDVWLKGLEDVFSAFANAEVARSNYASAVADAMQNPTPAVIPPDPPAPDDPEPDGDGGFVEDVDLDSDTQRI